MATTVVTVAPTQFAAGNHGPYASGKVTIDPNGYAITFTKTSNWPASGDVVTVTIEISQDNGTTWQFDASITYVGGAWNVRGGGTTNSVTWTVSGPPPGTTNIRATLNVHQAMKLGVAVATL